MNITAGNECSGSGVVVVSPRSMTRTQCHRCRRNKIRVRVNGALYIHSKKGPKS